MPRRSERWPAGTPCEAGANGRFLVASDPLGAVFGVWEAGSRIGIEIYNEPGAFGWNECWTVDAQASQAFYGAVFPFVFTPMEIPGMTYATFGFPTETETPPLGGMPQQEAGGQNAWLAYFHVDSTDRVVALTERSGGEVRLPAWDSPYGRMAILVDAQGAVFATLEESP